MGAMIALTGGPPPAACERGASWDGLAKVAARRVRKRPKSPPLKGREVDEATRNCSIHGDIVLRAGAFFQHTGCGASTYSWCHWGCMGSPTEGAPR